MLGGKLAALVVSERACNQNSGIISDKSISQNIIDECHNLMPREPAGVNGNGAIAFGGGEIVKGG